MPAVWAHLEDDRLLCQVLERSRPMIIVFCCGCAMEAGISLLTTLPSTRSHFSHSPSGAALRHQPFVLFELRVPSVRPRNRASTLILTAASTPHLSAIVRKVASGLCASITKTASELRLFRCSPPAS